MNNTKFESLMDKVNKDLEDTIRILKSIELQIKVLEANQLARETLVDYWFEKNREVTLK